MRIDRGRSRLEDELHEICDGVEALREALLDHFAREQEALLPFVVARVPAERERAAQFVVEHDHLAASLTALVKTLGALTSAAALAEWRAGLEAFEADYAAHTRAELAFLAEVAELVSSDSAATEQLRTLFAES